MKLFTFKRNNKPDIILSHILEGWKNLIFKNKSIEETALKRAKICSKCEFAIYNGFLNTIIEDEQTKVHSYMCRLCGCPLSAKIRVPEEICNDYPSRWKDV